MWLLVYAEFAHCDIIGQREKVYKKPATSERQRRRRRYEERMDNYRPAMRDRVRQQTNKRVTDCRRRAKERLEYDDDFEY